MAIPAVVTGIQVTNLLSGRRFLVEWNPNLNTDSVTQYNIYRSTTELNEGFSLIGTVVAPTIQFIDQVPFTFGAIFYYKVTAVNNSGYSSDITETRPVSDATFDDFEEKPFRSIVTVPVVGEVPAGAIDGNNKAFKFANLYKLGTTAIYINGLRQQNTVDYTENPDQQSFTFIAAPAPTFIVTGDYVRL